LEAGKVCVVTAGEESFDIVWVACLLMSAFILFCLFVFFYCIIRLDKQLIITMSLNRIKYLFRAAMIISFLPAPVLASSNPIEFKFLGVSVKERAERAIDFVLSIAGAIALLVIIISGIMMIASAGNPDAQQKAKKTLISGLTGLILVICSYIFINFTDSILVR
jgi:cytochrome c oxidase assembly factor CtaG